jgi:hypothetical protein
MVLLGKSTVKRGLGAGGSRGIGARSPDTGFMARSQLETGGLPIPDDYNALITHAARSMEARLPTLTPTLSKRWWKRSSQPRPMGQTNSNDDIRPILTARMNPRSRIYGAEARGTSCLTRVQVSEGRLWKNVTIASTAFTSLERLQPRWHGKARGSHMGNPTRHIPF